MWKAVAATVLSERRAAHCGRTLFKIIDSDNSRSVSRHEMLCALYPDKHHRKIVPDSGPKASACPAVLSPWLVGRLRPVAPSAPRPTPSADAGLCE